VYNCPVRKAKTEIPVKDSGGYSTARRSSINQSQKKEIVTMKLNRKHLIHVSGLAVAMFGLATASLAHHSQSQYDTVKKISIEGTLMEIAWSNPHTLFYINAKRTDDQGTALERWIVEGPAPRGLTAAGWEKENAKVGDKVTMFGAPRKDGKPQLLLQGITLPDGRKLSFRNDGKQGPRDDGKQGAN